MTITARIPITDPAPLPLVPPPPFAVGVTVGALRTAADPDDGSVVSAGGTLVARGMPAGVALGAGVGGGIGVGNGRSVGVGGASVAAIAVTPASAVSAAAVFVGPIVGACAATAGTALPFVTQRTASMPTVNTTHTATTFIARVRGMALPPLIREAACLAPHISGHEGDSARKKGESYAWWRGGQSLAVEREPGYWHDTCDVFIIGRK